ncbi:hypothetical protein VP01_88g6 [Puccinia sorghi]|uniref:Retrovirus-related Pol polyprotein from transposon TNT 1-94-like beta-barrel domain-containing protein n=1 Tax=Puccinia sorghi TaxID=27349 RepID=A0A0L6U835_9BASI|nr:hypothetical protein VP01_88g6 [Puccinia sorghi]
MKHPFHSMEPLPMPSTRNMPRPPSATLTKLQEIVHLEESRKSRTTGPAKLSENSNEDQSNSVAALMHESKKGKRKVRRGPFCAPGKHNPEASHDADHCWQLHPELRPNSSGKSPGTVSSQTPTTQLVEVDEGHESEVSLFLTETESKPTVLDSGATHHLVNNPDAFHPVAESNIKIATGGHSNFLNATAVGTATLVNHLGERLTLDNVLLVPTLTRSLISIPRLFKHEILITKTTGKEATIVIDKRFKLLGTLKNNLLELHSSHFEVINSHSTCYQSSPVKPNWHARLGHPYRVQYLQRMQASSPSVQQ